jgi:hypothetical protein
MEAQSADAVLMVRPASFGFNAETFDSNRFQHLPSSPQSTARHATVLAEFDAVAGALAHAGVHVIVAPDSPLPVKPDAIFPNNWVSFHADGTVVLYPMMAHNRRSERREDIVLDVLHAGPYRSSRTIDLSHREAEGKFLEGTGSLVLDRAHRIAYACTSPRTDLDVLGEFAQSLGYDIIAFDALDQAGHAIYHTNVMMAVGTSFAVLCADSIADTAQRAAVRAKLRASGHEVIDITPAQMQAFAGNVLELHGARGAVLAVSVTAAASFTAAQRAALEKHATLLPVAIPTIERCGGGGVRCMLAEVHLPKMS